MLKVSDINKVKNSIKEANNTLPEQVIKIKYIDDDMPRLEKLVKGDWIDLRSAYDVTLEAGKDYMINLGVAMELPKGYEAILAPRSSSYKKFGFTQNNSVGVIDSTFCGNNDVWHLPIHAHRDAVINKHDRICQFRIQEIQPTISFIEVDDLGNKDRSGFGSTGVK